MTVRAASQLTIAYVIVGAVALTFPGIVPFNRTSPAILGMPFVVVWVAAWALIGVAVLYNLERTVTRAEDGQAKGTGWNAGN